MEVEAKSVWVNSWLAVKISACMFKFVQKFSNYALLIHFVLQGLSHLFFLIFLASSNLI